jgi:hypothetical protein
MILRSINSSTDLISFLLIKIQSSFLLDRLFFFLAVELAALEKKCSLAQLLGPPVLPGPFRTTLFWGPKMAPKKGAPGRAQEGPGRGLFRALKIPENPGNFRPQKTPDLGQFWHTKKCPKNPPPRLEKFQGRFSVKPQRLCRKGLQGTSS